MAHRAALIALVVVAAAVYAPLAEAPFVYEDAHSLGAEVAWSTRAIPSRILALASLQGTPTPGAAHLGNVAIHLVNGALVGVVAATVAGAAAAAPAMGLFLLHPLNAEAVSYVSGRTDLLMTCGALLAVVGALRGWWALMTVGVVVAAMSKEIGLITAPLTLLSVWAWRPQMARAASGVAIAGGGAVLLARGRVLAGWFAMTGANGGTSASWPTYLAWQSTATVGLARRVVWPTGLTLDHDWIAVSQAQQAVCAGLVLAAIALLVVAWRTHRMAAWAMAWLLIAVVPRFVFRQSELLHEQQWYLGMTAVSVAIGSVVGPWLAVAHKGQDDDEGRITARV